MTFKARYTADAMIREVQTGNATVVLDRGSIISTTQIPISTGASPGYESRDSQSGGDGDGLTAPIINNNPAIAQNMIKTNIEYEIFG